MGIPTNSVIEYEMAVKTDNYLLMVHGSTPDIEKARDIIEGTRPIHVAIHSPEVHALAVR
jgi:hypothetical protein